MGYKSFKMWLEVVELRKPDSSVVRKNVTKDPGTNVSKKVIQYHWVTKMNNKVTLQLAPNGPGEYEVIFYVNDVLYDNGSKLGIGDSGSSRDADILSNVFYVLKKKADQLKANVLTFRAYKSSGDTKAVRNLEIDKPKHEAISELDKFIKALSSHKVTMTPLTPALAALYTKIGRPLEPTPDINVKSWLEWARKVHDAIISGHMVDSLLNDLKSSMNRLGNINVNTLIQCLENFHAAFMSRTERGHETTKNRRAVIYKRVLDRYFHPQWNIKVSGDNFTLTRNG